MKPYHKKKTVALLSSTLIALIGCNENSVNLVDKSPRPVNVIEIGSQNAAFEQYFTGRLQSRVEAQVSFRVPGTIEKVFVTKGDIVEKGQRVAQLDSHDYQVTLLELEARLTEAEAAHALADSELRRVKQAISDNAIASVNLDRARSAYYRTKSAVEVVTQNINKAKDAISYTTLRSPFNGVIGEQNYEEYEQVLPSIPVFVIHKPKELEATIDVPENLISLFEKNQAATVFWHGYEREITSRVTEVGTSPHPIKQTYPVTFQLTEKDDKALPGKSVIVRVYFKDEKNTYCLPYSAVFSEEDQSYIYTVMDNKAIKETVKIEHLQGDNACLSGNIKEKDIIITSGVNYLKDNQAVGKLIYKKHQ